MTATKPLRLRPKTPILLRRMRKKPIDTELPFGKNQGEFFATHMTIVTTGGMQPEMHDQQEDAHR